jgi:hypothetical protein
MALAIRKMSINLDENQKKAVSLLRSGSILVGGVGSGKSRTAIAYHFVNCGGGIRPYSPMEYPRKLYIITTAKKRDDKEWEKELIPFLIDDAVIDSWNNISKYKAISNAYFIFDEQRVVGSGQWVKSFLKITKPEANNNWILVTATPGDNWMDYIPVFIANGFYKNRTEFSARHVVWKRYIKFPVVEKFVETRRLESLRDKLMVYLYHEKHTVHNNRTIVCDYNREQFKKVLIDRWNPYSEEPIKNVSEYCYTLRKIVNSDESRISALRDILMKHGKVIVFYNFDYELDILRSVYDCYAEWNGHKHQPIPDSKSWLYLVQYAAGAEGWECTVTDTVVFYSGNYSYKQVIQASGRIDRRNTPFKNLYYYQLTSNSWIDSRIRKAYDDKQIFNEVYYGKV